MFITKTFDIICEQIYNFNYRHQKEPVFKIYVKDITLNTMYIAYLVVYPPPTTNFKIVLCKLAENEIV